MAKITFGYWDIRGLAEPIRYLLHYKKVKFEDKRYQIDSDAWSKDKFNLDLEFPNLPYYIEGDLKLSQSITILRYLSRKYDLDGRTDQEKLRVSLVEQQIIDLRWGLAFVIVSEDFDKKRPEFEKNAPPKLKEFVAFLGDNKFLVGDGLTYVDFLLVETLDFYRYFSQSILDEFPTLRAYQKRMKELPELHDYLHSSTFKRWPIFGPRAFWGSSGDEPKID